MAMKWDTWGMTWLGTATQLGLTNESTCRMMVDRYFIKLCVLCENNDV